MIEFFLGGARSGKSLLAEKCAYDSDMELVYIATAERRDREMAERISHHQRQRAGAWATVEESLQLVAALQRECRHNRCVLVDCLTLWLSNWLEHDPAAWPQVQSDLLALLPSLEGKIIFVSNEVGQGVVPVNALARNFVDESGRLHQALAAVSDRVYFVMAGIPQVIKEN
ncbi:MAG: adenosylcobinamide kinase/adenosylcobinamide-phosphate guanylyltransferase [Bacteroidia bacterium]